MLTPKEFGFMRRAFSACRRIVKERSGVSAVEFALVSGPFFALLLSIVEVGLLSLKMSLIQDAVATTARQVKVGEAQATLLSQDEFEDLICSRVRRIMDCENNVTVELRTIKSYTDVPDADPTCLGGSEAKDEQPDVSYELGGSGEVTFARVCITTPIFTPGFGIGLHLRKVKGNKFAIVESIVFRNEPFDEQL